VHRTGLRRQQARELREQPRGVGGVDAIALFLLPGRGRVQQAAGDEREQAGARRVGRGRVIGG
jgi:hypothetical protein